MALKPRASCALRCLIALAAAACNGATDTNPDPRVAWIGFIAPTGNVVVVVGRTIQLEVVVKDSGDVDLERPHVEFTAGPPSAGHANEPGEATVDANGRVTGVRAGWLVVTACYGGVCASLDVYVRNLVAAIVFGVDSLRLIVDHERQLSPVARDSDGKPFPPIAAVRIEFASADPHVATVDSTGKVRALSEGRTMIVASAEGIVATLPISTFGLTFEAVSRGSYFACGLTTDGAALCWGRNGSLQLGAVTPTQCIGSGGQYCGRLDSALPLFVSGSLNFTQLSAGGQHACGLTETGAVYCWGNNSFGQLGAAAPGLPYCRDLINGESGQCTAMPLAVEGGLTFGAITAGDDHTCALTRAGAAYCWGGGRGGKLGNGSTDDSATPVAVSGGHLFRNLSAGSEQTCGVTTSGDAFCWGLNLKGNLGIGGTDTVPHTSPARVQGSLSFEYVGSGTFAACGLTGAGRVYCWGGEANLGTAAPEECPELEGSGWVVGAGGCSTRPVRIASNLTFASLAVGASMQCALTAGGTAYCWGGNGGLPTVVTAVPPLRTVSAGRWASGCGVTLDDTVYCWDFDLVAHRVPGQR